MTLPTKAFSEASNVELAPSQKEAVEINSHDFCYIFEPIKSILDQDIVYMHYETGIHHQVLELRQMCVEAQAMQTINDRGRREERNVLINALQGIIESIEDARDDYIMFDGEDIAGLSKTTDIIRENAVIYREFVHRPNVAVVLENVADNIDHTQLLKHNFEQNLTSLNNFDSLAA